MSSLTRACRRFWQGLRAVTGDDAYERYLQHAQRAHPGSTLLDRSTFYRAELDRRWKGINRCC